MLEPKIDFKDLEAWASFLLDHSLGGICSDDRVMIKGERIAWPLMEILERRVIEANGIPDVYLVSPNNERGRVWSFAMGRNGTAEQIKAIPAWHGARYDSMTKYVEVLGCEDPNRYFGLTPEQSAALAGADRPFLETRLSKRWVITLFPTPGFAAMEGLDLDEYTNFIVRASTTDPGPLRLAEERIAPIIQQARNMTIATYHPYQGRELVLEMSLAPSRPVLGCGLHNFPDGEVYTSPDAASPSGEIFFDLPVHQGATDIQGIYLRLSSGRIVEYSARAGGDELKAIIETDEGSKRLGEVALGMNPALDRVLKHPLFVEKVGGTLHIAIGASCEEAYVADPASDEGKAVLKDLQAKGVLNKSARHVDVVADFRPGGCGRRVLLDEHELVVDKGLWAPK